MKISIKKDTETALFILKEVAQWLADHDMELWGVHTLTKENLVTTITEGHFYVIYVDDEPAGTFILQWEDPLFWDEIPVGTCGFIHKLAIRRAFTGQKLFEPILAFCKSECLSKGINEIRLDTQAGRPKLLNFYESHGFVRVRRKQIQEFGQQFDCMLFELKF